MSESLVVALVKHALKNCPPCSGTGQVVIDRSMSFGRPMKYVECSSCKELRDALKEHEGEYA